MNVDAARFPIAASVSPEAKTKLEGIRAFLSNIPQPPVPETVEDFDAAAARAEVFSEHLGKAAIDALGIVATERTLGGVPTLDIVPQIMPMTAASSFMSMAAGSSPDRHAPIC